MKLIDVVEMTMKYGSAEPQLQSSLSYFQTNYKSWNYVGDIDETDVYRTERGNLIDYAVVLQEQIIAFFIVRQPNELTIAYVIPEYRKRGTFSKFLLWLKINQGMSQIVLDPRHSDDAVEAVKRISKRFKISWVKDNEKVPYNLATVNQFYSLEKPTGWQIMLENDGTFSHWQKQPFRDPCGAPNQYTWYSIFLD